MTLRIMPVRCNTSNFSEYNPSIEQVYTPTQSYPHLFSYTFFIAHQFEPKSNERELSEGKRRRNLRSVEWWSPSKQLVHDAAKGPKVGATNNSSEVMITFSVFSHRKSNKHLYTRHLTGTEIYACQKPSGPSHGILATLRTLQHRGPIASNACRFLRHTV